MDGSVSAVPRQPIGEPDMATQLLTKRVDGPSRREAAEVAEALAKRDVSGRIVQISDGSSIVLPERLTKLLSFVVAGLTRGDLKLSSFPDELTTSSASELLGVSRPALMKLARAGEIPSHRVGSHTRFALKDVQVLKAQRDKRQRAALTQLRELELEQGIHG